MFEILPDNCSTHIIEQTPVIRSAVKWIFVYTRSFYLKSVAIIGRILDFGNQNKMVVIYGRIHAYEGLTSVMSGGSKQGVLFHSCSR